jgi:hypothetical protein
MLAALLLVSTPALAQEPEVRAEIVSPDEFRNYVEGYTVYFEQDGQPFGSESFEPGGKTRWRFNDGSCVRGVWRPYGAQVCFLYDMPDDTGPLCWRMLRDGEEIIARLLDGPDAGMEIRITGRDKTPLLCGEPGRNT